jgi:Zinc carboxypeptidase
MRLRSAVVGLIAIGAGAGAGPASAAELLRADLAVPSAVERSCTERELVGGEGYAQRTVVMPAAGAVAARLTAAEGDWDLAVLEADTGQVVAGSAHRGAREIASGYAIAGERLVVQACRLSGGSSSAGLSVESTAVDTTNVRRSQLVRVSTPTLERRNELVALGLDSTEHGGPGYLEVVLHGADDARRLKEAGFQWTVEVPDLALQARRDRLADLRFARAGAAAEFPSGQSTYRRLFDYSEDMKRLAREHPDLVRPITLNHLTYEGRPVEGIEIATDPNARDGRPVFLQMGLHHAREWPSGEHAIEWAYELITGYRGGDARARSLVESTRTIVVPVVNPDGFNASREAGQLYMRGDGHHTDLDGSGDISDPEFILAAATSPNEYRRKNCRLPGDPAAGSCLQPSTGIFEGGVDPNRNYGAFWGGPGSSGDFFTQTYRGPGPFSEPESHNVRELVSTRQVTTLITNHTFSNLVLRPPGLASQGLAPDEPALKALGDAMAAENGYASQYGWQLYDTTGTTEDWSYSATGGFGYTFEIGDLGFHPPFAETLGEWSGSTDDATGGGNREAFYKAQAHTADATKHSVLAGRAPANAVLRLTKTFETPAYDGTTFTDTLNSTMRVGPDGLFEWHTNPSTRPLGAKSRPASGEPSPAQAFAARGESTPCANFDDPPETCYEDHQITVPSGDGIDNATARIRIEWGTPASDYDLKVLEDGEVVATSGQGTTNFEETTLTDPAGSYVVRVINYAAAEPWTGSVTFAAGAPNEETWTLSCEQPEGTVRSARQVFVERGERRALDLRRDCRIRR